MSEVINRHINVGQLPTRNEERYCMRDGIDFSNIIDIEDQESVSIKEASKRLRSFTGNILSLTVIVDLKDASRADIDYWTDQHMRCSVFENDKERDNICQRLGSGALIAVLSRALSSEEISIQKARKRVEEWEKIPREQFDRYSISNGGSRGMLNYQSAAASQLEFDGYWTYYQ